MSFSNQSRPPFDSSKLMKVGFVLFLILVLFTVLSNTTFLTSGAGQKGVLFKRFSGGLEKDNVYAQGFHVIAPWNTMYIYDVRVDEEIRLASEPNHRLEEAAPVIRSPRFW